MRRIPRKTSRFNQLVKLLAKAHSEDRNKLVRYLVNEKGFEQTEIADVLGCSKQNVNQMIQSKHE